MVASHGTLTIDNHMYIILESFFDFLTFCDFSMSSRGIIGITYITAHGRREGDIPKINGFSVQVCSMIYLLLDRS